MAKTKAQERAAATKEHKEKADKEREEGYPTLNEDVEVEFAHPKTGQSYGASVKAFRDLYQPLGFEVLKRADDTPLPFSQPLVFDDDGEVLEPEEGEEPALVFPDLDPDTAVVEE